MNRQLWRPDAQERKQEINNSNKNNHVKDFSPKCLGFCWLMKPAAGRMVRVAEYQQGISQGTYKDRQKEAGLNEDEDTPKKIFREKKL